MFTGLLSVRNLPIETKMSRNTSYARPIINDYDMMHAEYKRGDEQARPNA
jgi:hypothetical protein